MASKFTPLLVGLVDEGRFLTQADNDLLAIQEALVGFIHEHRDRAKKAKATLTLQVTLVCEDPENEAFSIKAVSKTTLPNRPASMTLALAGENTDDVPCLFVRRSGSTDDNPAQNVLATQDGRTVNTETGEVLNPKGGKG